MSVQSPAHSPPIGPRATRRAETRRARAKSRPGWQPFVHGDPPRIVHVSGVTGGMTALLGRAIALADSRPVGARDGRSRGARRLAEDLAFVRGGTSDEAGEGARISKTRCSSTRLPRRAPTPRLNPDRRSAMARLVTLFHLSKKRLKWPSDRARERLGAQSRAAARIETHSERIASEARARSRRAHQAPLLRRATFGSPWSRTRGRLRCVARCSIVAGFERASGTRRALQRSRFIAALVPTLPSSGALPEASKRKSLRARESAKPRVSEKPRVPEKPREPENDGARASPQAPRAMAPSCARGQLDSRGRSSRARDAVRSLCDKVESPFEPRAGSGRRRRQGARVLRSRRLSPAYYPLESLLSLPARTTRWSCSTTRRRSRVPLPKRSRATRSKKPRSSPKRISPSKSCTSTITRLPKNRSTPGARAASLSVDRCPRISRHDPVRGEPGRHLHARHRATNPTSSAQSLAARGVARKTRGARPLDRPLGTWRDGRSSRCSRGAHRDPSRASHRARSSSRFACTREDRVGFDPRALESRGHGAEITVVVGPLARGVIAPAEGLVLVTEEEIFRKSARTGPRARLQEGDQALPRRSARARRGRLTSSTWSTASASTSGLDAQATSAGSRVDLLVVEYAGGDKLYLPGLSAEPDPEVLGRRGRRPSSIDSAARRSRRPRRASRRPCGRWPTSSCASTPSASAQPGQRFPTPDDDYRAFEATFPFDETPRSGARDRRGATATSRAPAPDGPPGLRRRRLRQDRGRDPRGVPRGVAAGKQVARALPDHGARAAALPHVRRAHARLPAQRRGCSRVSVEATSSDETIARLEGGQGRRRHRHAPPALEGRSLQGSRPAGRRRRAALRRHPQGAHQAARAQRRRAHAHGDADPAHAADGGRRAARHVAHHDAARRSPRDPHHRDAFDDAR